VQHFKYHSYEHYLDSQYQSNINRTFFTKLKADLRAEDIRNIQSVFTGKRCLCVGCRLDEEVDDFNNNGYDAKGIDILPTNRQIQGDMHRMDLYFKQCSFDLAYASHALEHSYDPIKVLSLIRKICTEGLYMILPLRNHTDEYEPVLFNVMRSRATEDLQELKPGLGDFQVIGSWVRDMPFQPSGAEIAFAIKWLD